MLLKSYYPHVDTFSHSPRVEMLIKKSLSWMLLSMKMCQLSSRWDAWKSFPDTAFHENVQRKPSLLLFLFLKKPFIPYLTGMLRWRHHLLSLTSWSLLLQPWLGRSSQSCHCPTPQSCVLGENNMTFDAWKFLHLHLALDTEPRIVTGWLGGFAA